MHASDVPGGAEPPTTTSGEPPRATPPRRVAAVIPAKDEADRVAATITAVQGIAGLDVVLVVDDGSTDDTARVAQTAGAVVVRHERNRGKAAAMATGLAHLVTRDAEAGQDPRDRHAVIFVDADLEASAANLGVLIPPVLTGQADLTIATLPPQRTAGGGHGFVVRLARNGIQDLTGFTAVQPLSGQRCLSPAAIDAATPLAPGWGVETGMTIDVLRAGLRVLEVPCSLQHRVTGADWRGQLHRARQYRDVALALSTRRAQDPRRAAAALRERREPQVRAVLEQARQRGQALAARGAALRARTDRPAPPSDPGRPPRGRD